MQKWSSSSFNRSKGIYKEIFLVKLVNNNFIVFVWHLICTRSLYSNLKFVVVLFCYLLVELYTNPLLHRQTYTPWFKLKLLIAKLLFFIFWKLPIPIHKSYFYILIILRSIDCLKLLSNDIEGWISANLCRSSK